MAQLTEFERAMIGLMQKAGGTAMKTVGTPTTSLPYARGMFGCSTETAVLSALQIDHKFAEWLGFLPSTEAIKHTKILEWVGPDGAVADNCDWDRTEACADCPTVEWGKCELYDCFGEVCGKSPALRATEVGLSQWQGQPRFFVQGPFAGQQIRDDEDWMMSVVAQVLQMNLSRMLILGNKGTNALAFDGLRVKINTPVTDVRTGLRCEGAEPIIYNWANAAIDADICSVIDAIVRELRRKASYLGGVNSAAGDMVLVCTATMRNALLDYVACGCGACASDSAMVTIDALRRRDEIARLFTGGLYGDGMIEVDGVPVHIIVNDWIPQTSIAPRFCSDIFILTRRTGMTPILYGEYQDFASTMAGKDLSSRINGWITDNGRFLHWAESQQECYAISSLMKTRMVLHAPWLQARITNVCAPFVLEPVSPDPCDDYHPAVTLEEAVAVPEVDYGNC